MTQERYIDRIRDKRSVWLEGERVPDVTSNPLLSDTVACIQAYYDLHHASDVKEIMTCRRDGEDFSTSFLIPRTKRDLRKKREAYLMAAELSFGMLGRTPDFVNSCLAAIASMHRVLDTGANRIRFGENALNYYLNCRRRNLFAAHAAINPQIDRSKSLSEQTNDFAGVRVVSESPEGIVVKGAKMIATLAPIADEILIFNMPGLQRGDEDFALAFAAPATQENMKLICRKPLVHRRTSLVDHPISNKFDEMDAFVVFEESFIPWDRVFVYKDVEKSNQFFDKTFARHHSGHQGIVRSLSKAKFLVAVSIALAKLIKVDHFVNIQERLGRLTSCIELVKGAIELSESQASKNDAGVICPNIDAIQAIRYHFPLMYKQMIETVQSLVGGSMMAVPHSSELDGINGETLEACLSNGDGSSQDRVKLLNLAWDVSGDGFGQRQYVYEMYHAGDPMRIASQHFLNYQKDDLQTLVERAFA